MALRAVSPRRLVLISALVVIYALCYTAIKAGLAYSPPLRYAGLRAGIGGLLILSVSGFRTRRFLPARRFLSGTLALALIGTTLGYGSMFLSPGRTGAGISSVLGNTGTILLGILGWLLLEEPLTRAKAEGLAIGAMGVTLIAYPAVTEPSLAGPSAVLLPLLAALALSLSAVILKRLDVGDELELVIGWQLLLGAVFLTGLSVCLEGGMALVAWTPIFVALLAFLSTLGTAAATWAWYWLVQREDVGRLGVFMFAVPLIGLVLARVLFDERASPHALAGAVLTIAAVLRVAWPTRNRGRASS